MRRSLIGVLILLMSLACALMPVSGALAEENLLINGGFDEVEDGMPAGWDTDMWLQNGGESGLAAVPEGRDGDMCIVVENYVNNDARFVQWVDVQPDTLYRLSGYIKTDGIDMEYGSGASLSVIGTYNEFTQVYNTDGEWVYIENYIVTALSQDRIMVGARVGEYNADNVGKAWFDDLSLMPVEAVPIEYEAINLLEYADLSGGDYSYTEETQQTPSGFSSIVTWALLFVALLIFLWIVRVYGVSFPSACLLGLLALAAALRLYLMATQPGHKYDMGCFFSWAKSMAEVGPGKFYAQDVFCDYPPGYLYFLWITGGLMNLLGANDLGMLGRVLVKLVPMLFDLGAIAAIFWLARKGLGSTKALLLSALYALNPAVLLCGAVWGQVDAAIAFGLLVTVIGIAKRRWIWALPAYMVTVLMKPQALMVGPLGLSALVLMIAFEKQAGERKKLLLDFAKGFLIAIVAAAAVLLPFIYGQEAPFAWLIELYAETLTNGYPYATVNAANLFYLIGANWLPLSDTFLSISYATWGTILIPAVVVAVIALYALRREEAMLPFFGALTFIGLYVFGVMMHERYLFPALVLLLYAYIKKPDVRILTMFVGYSLTLFLNCGLVLRDMHLAQGFGGPGVLLAALNILLFGLGVWVAVDRSEKPLPTITMQKREAPGRIAKLSGKTEGLLQMRALDYALVLLLTAAYATVAFVGLGDTVAPQTFWRSMPGQTSTAVFDLGEISEFTMMYYVGINTRQQDSFTVDFSADGENFVDPVPAKLNEGDCFKWVMLESAIYDNLGNLTDWNDGSALTCGARYVRITREGPQATLFEVAFHDLDGNLIPIKAVSGEFAAEGLGPEKLADEQAVVPAYPSYENSMYFDEIYHGRTGYEHEHKLYTYETTHPPLGKVLIMLSIRVFGMTPFGWRFPGTLMGVLMIPAMYLLAKLLFKRTRYALLAALLMALDMMHLTQTRIATIDSYAVLCIILMYLFMFMYMRMSFFRDGWRTLIPLFLSGLFMGIGCASKWICFYAGIGLAILFFWTLAQRFADWKAGMRAEGDALDDAIRQRLALFPRYVLGTLGACVLFFIVIPAAIYYASYIPYFAHEGGLTFERFISAQENMFYYHATLVATHPYQSPWFEWPLILRPMWYYHGRYGVGEGMVSSIVAMGNPAVWWVGAACVLYMIYRFLRPYLLGCEVKDHRPAMLLIAYLAQLVPWMFVSRAIFIYHYFGSLPFMILCIVFAFERLAKKWPRAEMPAMIGYSAVTMLLFVGFYPVATGVVVSRTWMDAMNWLRNLRLPGWTFGGWLKY